MIQRHLAPALLLIALACSPSAAQEKLRPNLAYEMKFVWHAADVLANGLLLTFLASDPDLRKEAVADIRNELAIIHYHLLVECQGPLPAIAAVLAPITYEPPLDGQALSEELALMLARPDVAGIIGPWQVSALPRVHALLRKGRYGFHPECIAPGFLAQNPGLRR